MVVIGGGDTAMDAARVATRLGASQVTVAYRRTRAEMPASEEELSGALQEGVELLELVSPVRVLREDGRVVGLECVRNRLGDPGPDGRRRPVPIPGSGFTLPADAVVVAIGQQADLAFLSGTRLDIPREGLLAVDPETGRLAPRLYAGGDITPGVHTIIAACGDGLRAARAICRELSVPFREPAPPRPELSREEIVAVKRMRARKEDQRRPRELPPPERRGFQLVETAYTPEEARAEAERCLQCSTLCDKCAEVCPNRANLTYFVPPVDWRVPVLAVQDGELAVVGEEQFRVTQSRQILHIDDLCNECGNCATFCVHQGKPYLEKPHLFLTEEGFRAEEDNAFYIRGDVIRRREGGEEASLARTDRGYSYEDAHVRVLLSPTFEVEELQLKSPFPGKLSLVGAAELAVILEGVKRSLPYLPGVR